MQLSIRAEAMPFFPPLGHLTFQDRTSRLSSHHGTMQSSSICPGHWSQQGRLSVAGVSSPQGQRGPCLTHLYQVRGLCYVRLPQPGSGSVAGSKGAGGFS